MGPGEPDQPYSSDLEKTLKPDGGPADRSGVEPSAHTSAATLSVDALLERAVEMNASDLHLIAGVPAAFRVNGEIILGDEDVLTDEQIKLMADSLLSEDQRETFEREWELCISLLHSLAGRVRVT